MSNDDARAACCSQRHGAIRRARRFNTARLERRSALLDATQKYAWHKGFCAVPGAAGKRVAHARA